MRGAIIILVCVACIAANITTYQLEDSFTLDDTTFTIQHITPERAGIRAGDFSSIWNKGDCQQTQRYHVCLERVNSESVDISTELINRSYTLTRTVPDSATLGEWFTVELVIQNHAPETKMFTLQDVTSAQTRRYTGINSDLQWNETIAGKQSRTLSYQARATKDVAFSAHVTSPYNTTRNHTVEIDDFITVQTDYTNQTTAGAQYNFSIDIDSEKEAEVILHINASGVRVHDRHNLLQQLTKVFFANQTPHAWFTYSVPKQTSTEIVLYVTTETSSSTNTRTYRYPVQDAFSPIEIIHDYKNATIPAQQEHEIGLTFYNPNDQNITARLQAQSVLVDIDEEIMLRARQTATKTMYVLANATGSEYTIQVSLTYQDVNGVQTTTRESLRLTSTPPQTPPSEDDTPAQPPIVRVASEQTTNGYALRVTPSGFTEATGTLTVQQDTQTVFSETVALNQTTTVSLLTAGTYRVHIQTNTTNQSAQHTTSSPLPEPVQKTLDQEPVQPQSMSAYVLLVLGACLLGLVFVILIVRAVQLKKRGARLIYTYEHTKHFLEQYTPKTPQDFALVKQIQEQLVELEKEIRKHKD